ncbi:unnamed protein product [Closterium sp. Naga37s-1]|nr:unnamed protein product [Closterium sp. Naga37s-1]
MLQHDDVTATAAAGACAGGTAVAAGEGGHASIRSTVDAEEPPTVVAPQSPRIPPLSVKLPLTAFLHSRPRKASSPSQQATSPSQQATSPSQQAMNVDSSLCIGTLADPSSPPGSLRKSLLLAEMFVAARRSAPVFQAYLADKSGGHVVASDWSTQLPRHLAEGVLGAFEWVAVGLEKAAEAAAAAARPKQSTRQQLAALLLSPRHKAAPLASPRRASPPLLSPRKSSPPPASPRASSPVGGQGDPKALAVVVRVVAHVAAYADWDTPAPFVPPPDPDAPTALVRTYGGALASIFREFGGAGGGGDTGGEGGGGVAEQGVTITGVTERIVGALMGVVEGKAAACDDDVTRALFMLNNTCIIQQ